MGFEWGERKGESRVEQAAQFRIGIREVFNLNVLVCEASGASKQRTECCFLKLRGEASDRTVKLGVISLQL